MTKAKDNKSSDVEKAEQIMGQALAEQARRYTYCLIDDTEETKISTAVAIKLGKRYFLATAKHVIENTSCIKTLVRNQFFGYVSDFDAKYYDDLFDIGLLEISSSNLHNFEFLPQNNICEMIKEEQKIPAMVVGFPGQFCKSSEPIKLSDENFVQIVRCDALTFNTHVLPRSEWPSDDSLEHRLINGRDMLIDYEPEDKIRPLTPKNTGKESLPVECHSLNPKGISGGGIWLRQILKSKENLSIPDTRLIGLQTGWYKRKNWLRGIRIGAWLDLVRDRYIDLREAV